MQGKRLFDEFRPVTPEQWKEKIIKDLKCDDFDSKLVWRTMEGIEVMPFYTRRDIQNMPYIGSLPGEVPFLRGPDREGRKWLIRQDIRVDDYKKANAKCLEILMRGVDSPGFIIDDPETVNRQNLEALLSGIHPEAVPVNFAPSGKAKEIIEIFTGMVADSGFDPARIKGSIEADPLSRLMLNGKLCISFEAGLDYLADLAKMTSSLPGFRIVNAGAYNFHNAGGDTVQELAFGLSMGSEYMSVLTERGIDPDTAASRIKFTFGIGSNYFFEMAKLRAARLLWSLITEKHNVGSDENRRMEIHSITGRWNKTLLDTYVNMLRTQTEAMSAVLGGADAITVEPFDIVSGSNAEFPERIARNQQLILREEAWFDKVADPAGGSYYIERITSMIADAAWKLFCEVEEAGGFTGSLAKGIIQQKIKERAERRIAGIASGKEKLLGTNLYPDRNQRILIPAAQPGSTDGNEKGKEIERIILRRGAEELERAASDKNRV